MTKNTFKKIIFVFLLGLFLFTFSQTVLAEGTTELQNPLGSIIDPRDIIGNVINAILGIVGSLALLMFIFGGFTWVTSAGNDEKIKKGRDMVLWAALGLGLIFLSYALLAFVLTAITGGTGAKNSTGGNATQSTGGNATQSTGG